MSENIYLDLDGVSGKYNFDLETSPVDNQNFLSAEVKEIILAAVIENFLNMYPQWRGAPTEWLIKVVED